MDTQERAFRLAVAESDGLTRICATSPPMFQLLLEVYCLGWADGGLAATAADQAALTEQGRGNYACGRNPGPQGETDHA